MPAWMEKIKDTFTAKADLKSLFIVLQPDNQVSTVMVVSYVPTDKDSFPGIYGSDRPDCYGSENHTG